MSKLNPFQTASTPISTDGLTDPALRVDRLSGPTLQVLPIKETARAAKMNPEMMKLAMEQMVNRTLAAESFVLPHPDEEANAVSGFCSQRCRRSRSA